VLTVAIAITLSVNRELLTIPSATAFSVFPSRSYASSKSSLNRIVGIDQKKYIHRLPASTLFAKENHLAVDTCTAAEFKIPSESDTAITNETKTNLKTNTNSGDIQRALAGLVLTLTIATTAIGGSPLPANAGFGPSSGATTTPPPNLKSITTTAAKTSPENAPTSEFNIDLDGKKLRILIDSTLNVRRLEDFSVELDVLIDSLRDSISSLTSGDDSDGETTKYDVDNNYIDTQREAARQRTAERQKELLKAEILQSQIERQEKSLVKLQSQPYWFNYFAAFVGSTVSTLIMHPVDTIKTRLQVGLGDDDDEEDSWQTQTPHEPAAKPRGLAIFGMSSATAAPAATKEAATGTTSKVSAFGDLGDLYEGLTGNLFKEVPPSAIYLGVYESVKYALVPKVAPAYLLLVYLVAGAAGETVGSIIRAPAEAVKSLVQSRAKDNALEAAKSVLGTADGRANVLRAWSASICRDVPFGAIQLAAFETIKAAILNNPNIELDSSTLLSEAVIGAFAGGLGALVTNPTDVITTRIITQDPTGDGLGEGEGGYEPLGVLEMGKKIYETEGAGAFFTGWEARVGYWAPAISIFLTCYCSVRRAGITYDIFS
jgi:hypothetical protein